MTANYAPEASNKAAICAGVVWTHVIVDWAWAIAVPSIVAHITTAILMPFRIGFRILSQGSREAPAASEHFSLRIPDAPIASQQRHRLRSFTWRLLAVFCSPNSFS